jgi:hypothetical protein
VVEPEALQVGDHLDADVGRAEDDPGDQPQEELHTERVRDVRADPHLPGQRIPLLCEREEAEDEQPEPERERTRRHPREQTHAGDRSHRGRRDERPEPPGTRPEPVAVEFADEREVSPEEGADHHHDGDPRFEDDRHQPRADDGVAEAVDARQETTQDDDGEDERCERRGE